MCMKREFIIESKSRYIVIIGYPYIPTPVWEVNSVWDEYIDRMQVCFLEQRYVP